MLSLIWEPALRVAQHPGPMMLYRLLGTNQAMPWEKLSAGSSLIQTGTFSTLVLEFPGRQGDGGSQESFKVLTPKHPQPQKSVKERSTWLT